MCVSPAFALQSVVWDRLQQIPMTLLRYKAGEIIDGSCMSAIELSGFDLDINPLIISNSFSIERKDVFMPL